MAFPADYILIADNYNGLCMNSSGKIDTTRSCCVEVWRAKGTDTAIIPGESEYIFKFYIANVSYTEQRYQHWWDSYIVLDARCVKDWNTAHFLFPKSSSLNSSGYVKLNKGQHYEVLEYVTTFKNDGTEHTIAITATCLSTTPKNCNVTLSFTTPVCTTVPEIDYATVEYTDTGDINKLIIQCKPTYMPKSFYIEHYIYGNDGHYYDGEDMAGVVGYTITPDVPTYRLELPGWWLREHLTDYSLILAGRVFHCTVSVSNEYGKSPITKCCTIDRPGSAAVRLDGGAFKNATPYVKVNGVWYPAVAYADTEHGWQLTKRSVEFDDTSSIYCPDCLLGG